MQQRNTKQKKIVFDTVCRMHNHPSADEIYEEIIKENPTVGRSTVFRVLSSLAEQQKVQRVRVVGCADRFDFNTCAHYHARCVKCGRIFDVKAQEIDIARISPQVKNFKVTSCNISFDGICDTCETE